MAKWMVSAKKADFNRIAQQFGIDPVIARIIRNRDLVTEEEINRFLNGTLDDLHSPYLLKDAEKVADILHEKIAEQKKIRIIGDYDIDGVCSTYILTAGLRACGAVTDAAIPHRILDGYGLNDRLILDAYEAGIDTIVTCDNGIAAASQISYAKSLGMTVVVTDHHEVPYEVQPDGSRRECLPEADAVVDPKQQACGYPFDGICGAVVAYKLVQVLLAKGLVEHRGTYTEKIDMDVFPLPLETTMSTVGKDVPRSPRRSTEPVLKEAQKLQRELLAFAAFATIGDVMELVDENRVIVKYGLRIIERSENYGLQALMSVNGLQNKLLSVYHIGFVLGPCLNATGRLDTAARALQMFLTEDKAEAVTIAGELKELNDSRKGMTLQGTEQAIDLIEQTGLKEDKVLVVYLPECHESLAGIIAGRIRERYQKPVFVLTKSEDGVKGSGRSIDAYHMYDKMSECKELYTKYGGHKLAAGVSMPEENVEKFRDYLNTHCELSPEDFEEKILIDVPMPMSYVTPAFVRQLSVLEPFGNGNPKPVFAQKNLKICKGRILGKNSNVGKYLVKDETDRQYDMVYFGNMELWHDFLTEHFGEDERRRLYLTGSDRIRISVIYYPDINVYQGKESLQMVMKDYSI
ncbi:MAG: single-stranded-DNA-specific exonuclease RecJ [Lachnospiraceae bacterium]|nr:single-stranded-DNA-specific exonuclease RecJ [Lachnospiraceae bacterium]